MKSSISRKDYHSTGAKVMRKLKGKGWVAASTGLAVLTGLSVVVAPIHAASPQSVESVLTSVLSSNFDEKADIVANEAIKEESSKALDSVTTKWTANSIEAIKQEIQRQKDAGLDAYVIQWGDTLSVLAEATDQATIDLGNLNGITNRDFIITGDVLIGVLEAEIRDTTSATPVQQVAVAPTPVAPVTPNRPQQPSKPVVPTTPVTPEKPVVPELPVTPETPETPEVPEKPEEPEIPETPETPVSTDVVIKEPVVEKATHTVLSEEIIYGGKTGEEVTTVANDKYVVSTDTIELSNETTPEEIGTEPYTDFIPEVNKVEKDVQIGENENGEPIYNKQLVEEATGNMIPVELTRDIVISPASTTIVSQTTTVYGLPFNVITQYDNTIDAGTEEIIQEGIEGQSSVVMTTTTVDAAVTSISEPVETTLIAAQDRIVKVGTKEAVGSKKVVMNSVVTTRGLIHRTDPTLYEGEEKSIEGQDGFVNQTIEITTIGETSTESVLEEATQEAISDIKIIGTKPVITTEKITVERPIAFETEYKEYADSDKKETVLQKGVNGLAIDTYLVTYTKGIESNRELLSSDVTLKPVTQIIQIGSITSDTYRTKLISEDEIIPSEIHYIYNSESTSPTAEIMSEGQDGLTRNLYEISYNNAGEVIGKVLVSQELINQQEDTVIQLSKQLVEIKTETVQHPTLTEVKPFFLEDFENFSYREYYDEHLSSVIEFVEDPSLPLGELVVVDKGSLGYYSIIVESTYYKGILIDQQYLDAGKESKPVKQIVKVGTNKNSIADDVIDQTSIKWMEVEQEVDEYDENGNWQSKIVTVKIPDLNHYFKNNVRKFSSLEFDQHQSFAILEIIMGRNNSYQLDKEFYHYSSESDYGPRLKGENLASLYTKSHFYQDVFLTENQTIPSEILGGLFRFNEEDFEFELDVAPEPILKQLALPVLDWAVTEDLTKLTSQTENNQLVETFLLKEERMIQSGATQFNDPTKFGSELSKEELGEDGLLTRFYEITKIDGKEDKRTLIDYELKLSKPYIRYQGIREGTFIGGIG